MVVGNSPINVTMRQINHATNWLVLWIGNDGVWDPVSKRSPHSKYNKCVKVSLLFGIICCIVTSLHLNIHVGSPSPLVSVSCMDQFAAWVKFATWGPIHFMFLHGELFPLKHWWDCLPPPFTEFITYAVWFKFVAWWQFAAWFKFAAWWAFCT